MDRENVGVECAAVVVEPPVIEKLVPFERLDPDYGISYRRVHVWRLMRAGKFPLSVKLAEGGSSAWLHSEIVAWIRSRPRAITVRPQKRK